MQDWLTAYSDQLLGPLIDPSKRIFVGYLLATALLGFGYFIVVRGRTPRQALSALFDKRVLWSQSGKADVKLFAANQAVMMGITPRLVSRLALATFLFESLHVVFAGRPSLAPFLPGWAVAGLYTLVLFLLDDATKYLLHRALHRIPMLWAFHKIHHSAETLTPLTVFRTHPVEGVLFALRATIVQAVTIAGFVFFFGDRASLLEILGANVFLFAFNILGANLRHSHIPIRYGRIVEHLLISPAQHQIHHSRAIRHHDRNFGAVLAVWDWLGGTLHISKAGERLRFGLGRTGTDHRLRALYLTPFTNVVALLPTRRILDAMSNISRHPLLTWMPTLATRRGAIGLSLFLAAATIIPTQASSASLNIYSHRQPFLIQPFLDAYTAKTGTEINVVFAKKGLAQRLQAEGENSPADLVLTVDIARLHVYADKDLLAPVSSEVLEKTVPAHLRDAQNRWFAFSKRARIIAIHKDAKGKDALQSYEDLATPAWRERICSRPGSHVYNRALLASIINADGEEAAEKWAQGLVDNLARRPQGNDRAQIKAIFEGQCDVAVVNNYYIGKLANSDKQEQRDWAAAVDLIFPNQDGRGTHINISGGGVAKYSKNKEEAIRFMEFLTSPEAQALYGSINYEYPVNPSVPIPDELSFGGVFKEDRMPISRIAELAPLAQRIIDRTGW